MRMHVLLSRGLPLAFAAGFLVACASNDGTETGRVTETATTPPGDPVRSAPSGHAPPEALASVTADGDASATPPATSACTVDQDCAAHELCVEGVCRHGCLKQADCAAGTCTFNPSDAGWCYNAPGCNPPPTGYLCPTTCYGYCE